MSDKRTIIIVDDDKFLLDMYTVKFSESGLQVEACMSSEDAIQKLRDGIDADAILLDIVMPGVDGFALLDIIKKEKLGEGMAVIVLSNQGEKEDIEKATALGAHGYIVKASTIPSEVLEKTLAIIEKHCTK